MRSTWARRQVTLRADGTIVIGGPDIARKASAVTVLARHCARIKFI
jgi:hypothetical protein